MTDPNPSNSSATDTDTLASQDPGYYVVSPCRFFDTRDTSLGGPIPLAGGSSTLVSFGGRCGVPQTAKAVSVNVTVTQPGAAGHLTIYPSDIARPANSVINFSKLQTRANNAVVSLGTAGEMVVFSGLATGTVHVIMDVNGYFR